MSEEPRYLVRNREMISQLMGIQELRLVVKTQLFDGTVVVASLSPYPPHRVTPYDVCAMMELHMDFDTTPHELNCNDKTQNGSNKKTKISNQITAY